MHKSNIESEEALLQLKNEMAAILENIDNGFISLDKDWRFVYINSKAAKNVGYEAKDLIGKNIWEKFPQIAGTEAETNYRTVMEERVSLQFQTHGVITNRWYEEKVYPTLEGIAIYWNDITERKETERKIEQSNQKITKILESIQENFYVLDYDWNYVYVNKNAADPLGMKPEDIIGHNVWKLFPRYIGTTFEENLRAAMANREVRRFELHGSYSKRVYQVDAFPSAEGISVLAIDITERMRVEEARKRSEEKYRQIVTTAQEGILMLDSKGNITFANEVMAKWLGYKVEEIIGEHPFKFVRKEDLNYAQNRWMAKNAGELENFDFRFQRKDGADLWVIVNATHLKDEQGKITGILAMHSNITERKKAEEALRASEEKANDLIKYAPSGIYELDYRVPPKFRSVNDAMCQILGYTREELLATSPFALLDDESKMRFRERILKMLAGEKVDETVEFKVIPKDGRDLYAALNVTFTYKDGKPDGALVIAHDITERKKAERALEERAKNLESLVEERTKALRDAERLAAIGATAGMVGHDIRNPLQAITGDVYLLKTELASMPEVEAKKHVIESLDGIEENVDYINKIVVDLQDFARPLNPNFEEADLELIIDDLLKKNGLPENVKISVNVESEVGKVRTDSAHISRIIYNLVNNAVQAMPKGGKLTIQAYKEANELVISVKDTGVGIPESVKSKLFTPMFTTKSKGQGFGLPVVKRMTESLGGTVTFESQEGRGTTFTIHLPTPRAKR